MGLSRDNITLSPEMTALIASQAARRGISKKEALRRVFPSTNWRLMPSKKGRASPLWSVRTMKPKWSA